MRRRKLDEIQEAREKAERERDDKEAEKGATSCTICHELNSPTRSSDSSAVTSQTCSTRLPRSAKRIQEKGLFVIKMNRKQQFQKWLTKVATDEEKAAKRKEIEEKLAALKQMDEEREGTLLCFFLTYLLTLLVLAGCSCAPS